MRLPRIFRSQKEKEIPTQKEKEIQTQKEKEIQKSAEDDARTRHANHLRGLTLVFAEDNKDSMLTKGKALEIAYKAGAEPEVFMKIRKKFIKIDNIIALGFDKEVKSLSRDCKWFVYVYEMNGIFKLETEQLLPKKEASSAENSQKTYVPPSRAGRRSLNAFVVPDLYDSVKKLSVDAGRTTDYLAHEAYVLLLKRYGCEIPQQAQQRLMEVEPKRPGPAKGSPRSPRRKND